MFADRPTRYNGFLAPSWSFVMASTWTQNGPVSLPPRSLAYGAAALLVALAAAGVALGLRAAWRESGAPGLAAGSAASASSDDTLTARPIVGLPAPAPPPDAAKDETQSDDTAAADQSKADTIAAKTVAAQAIQAKPSQPAGNIDDILTSASEKPAAPVKPPADEAPPGAPVKSDVPF
ncbi:MAG: hypothetical protein ACR2FH_00295 [Caulobacteraceae bacterium]